MEQETKMAKNSRKMPYLTTKKVGTLFSYTNA